MSLPNFSSIAPPIQREDAVNQILSSIAMEERSYTDIWRFQKHTPTYNVQKTREHNPGYCEYPYLKGIKEIAATPPRGEKTGSVGLSALHIGTKNLVKDIPNKIVDYLTYRPRNSLPTEALANGAEN